MTPEPKTGMRIWFRDKGITSSPDQIETIIEIDEEDIWFKSSMGQNSSLMKSSFKSWLEKDKIKIVEDEPIVKDEPKKLKEMSLPITDRKEWF